jgi:hypothetical protein
VVKVPSRVHRSAGRPLTCCHRRFLRPKRKQKVQNLAGRWCKRRRRLGAWAGLATSNAVLESTKVDGNCAGHECCRLCKTNRSSLQGYGEKRASKVSHKSYTVIKMQKCVAIGMMLGKGSSPQKPGMLVVFGILCWSIKLVSIRRRHAR